MGSEGLVFPFFLLAIAVVLIGIASIWRRHRNRRAAGKQFTGSAAVPFWIWQCAKLAVVILAVSVIWGLGSLLVMDLAR